MLGLGWRDSAGQGPPQGLLQSLRQLQLQILASEDTQLQFQPLNPVPVVGRAELTEHPIQQALQLLSMQATETIDQPAGEELLLRFDLQLKAMQQMAGSCWGAIPLVRGVAQLAGGEQTSLAGITVKSRGFKRFKGLHLSS